ncbi:ImmA/IrrE family metallo-endopeptidase [Methylobacterium pseudosasicola]|uniref:IrrE N-terminal-like domain-containing protein n=1 Tax=Methylobacterium pseudosasicola TaxID=582667 RepID=A0A1I4PTW9_9HYPH|nr:ImmA/IrrE family metallo-endopeptidase [Methylobacterium pseudosasicola]SFM31228.1 protein of unknown function [Methylobacterium pseudosasicola]
MTRRLTLSERLLQRFGVERPDEIDVEAIAWMLGAKVRYRELHSCEARIVGREDRAIITVDNRVTPRRQRFSVAHELGHWHHHRGRCLICRSEDIGASRRQTTDPERVANDYASDLLLPRYLLDPILRSVQKPTLKAVREVAAAFDASLTATLIKIVASDRYPLMMVCHGPKGRRWFQASPSIPSRWFPRDELDPESCAIALQFGSGPEEGFPRRIGADAWFDRGEARHYELLEQSYALPKSEVMTVLHLIDPKMTSDEDTSRNSL